MSTKVRPHGVRAKYVIEKCRCADCREATRVYEADRQRRRLYAQYNPDLPAMATDLVDAQPVRDHIQLLSEAGIGWKRVAALAEVATGTVYPILYGRGGNDPAEHRPPRRRVRREIAEKILAVQPSTENLCDGAYIDSTGTSRRLQALVGLGYSIAYLGGRLGILPPNTRPLVYGSRQVTKKTAMAVSDLYEELWDRPRVSDEWHTKTSISRARALASRNHWMPPMAWDDIDDPDETPDLGARPARGLDVEEVEFLLSVGESATQVANRTGYTPAYLERRLHELGCHNLAGVFHQAYRQEKANA